jgi:hypothetical protein
MPRDAGRWNKSIGPLLKGPQGRAEFAERTSVSCFSLALEQPPTKASAECGRDGASPRPGHHYRQGRTVDGPQCCAPELPGRLMMGEGPQFP